MLLYLYEISMTKWTDVKLMEEVMTSRLDIEYL